MGTQPAAKHCYLSFSHTFLTFSVSALLVIVLTCSAHAWDNVQPISRSIAAAIPLTSRNLDLGISEIVDDHLKRNPALPPSRPSIDLTATSPALKSSVALGMPDDVSRPAVIVRRSGPKEREFKTVLSKSSLTFGYIFDVGLTDNDRSALDLFMPADVGPLGTFFLETRSEHQNLLQWGDNPAGRRWDLSFGIGYRKQWGNGFLIGANYFIDSSLMSGEWSRSVGFGFETALRLRIDQEVDFNLNFYRGGGVDAEVGYMFPVRDDYFDLRLKLAKYRFYDGEFILGWRTGVDLYTTDRTLAVTYEFGQDSRDPAYHSVALSASIPMRLGNILVGKNPFYKPELFNRDARTKHGLLAERVKRSWRQPTTVVAARNTKIGKQWSTPGKVRWGWVKWSDSKTDESSEPKKDSKESCRPSDQCRQCCCCTCCCEKKSRDDCTDSSDDIGLVDVIYGTGIVALGTYTVSDYLYRSAFGPFEDDPQNGVQPKGVKR